MTISLTHQTPEQRTAALLEEAVFALVEGPTDPVRLQRAAQLGNPTKLCCVIVNAALESLLGIRPMHQLIDWVTPEVYEQLTARAQVRATRRPIPGSRTPGSAGGRAGAGTPQKRTQIITTRVVRVSAVAAEATVIIHDGNRPRAAALRVEEHRGRWRVCALEIG